MRRGSGASGWRQRSVPPLRRPCAEPISRGIEETAMDDKTRTELEAAAFRRLVAHLQERTDVQNLDLMNLAGFCRNCLSRWYREEAGKKGIEVADPKAREIVYGMPYDEWKAKHQKDASGDQKKAFGEAHKHG